jgi:hypothetical protein
MAQHEKINYLEFPAKNIAMTKTFLKLFSIGHLKISAQTIPLFLTKALMAASSHENRLPPVATVQP